MRTAALGMYRGKRQLGTRPTTWANGSVDAIADWIWGDCEKFTAPMGRREDRTVGIAIPPSMMSVGVVCR